MTIGIYSITHRETGKRYIGKSINIESRFSKHRHMLRLPERNEKQTNRHLWNAVQKHGIDAFDFEIVEVFDAVDEALIAERELHWMDTFKSCDRKHGYNLRRDSATKMEVHDETRLMQSVFNLGKGNPNFGNNWSESQKMQMADIARTRHRELDVYGDEWKAKLSSASRKAWACPEKRKAMGEKVALKKQKYDFEQYTKDGKFVRKWSSIKEIVLENPSYKWQNIYNVCHGHKPSYMGYVWKQVLKEAA